jgi:peptide/nickel transport system substrate-binding protein
VHRHLYEDQPYTFLFVPDALPILHRRFQEVRPTPVGIWYNFIDWYVPRPMQRYRPVLEP